MSYRHDVPLSRIYGLHLLTVALVQAVFLGTAIRRIFPHEYMKTVVSVPSCPPIDEAN